MTNPYDPKNPSGNSSNQEHGKESRIGTLKSTDIAQMLKNNGTVKVGNEEFAFKNANDPKLRELSTERDIEVKPIGGSASNGECQYELRASGKTPVTVTICKK